MMSDSIAPTSGEIPSGRWARLPSASLTWISSAKTPSFDVEELPAAERNAGVHGVGLLGGHRGPVGGDGGDDHLVANLEVLDHGSHFNDLTNRLVAEHHVVAFPTPPS